MPRIIPSPPLSVAAALVAVLWGGAPSRAAAQEMEVLRICASIAHEASRLSCFDRLVESMGVSTAGPEGVLWVVEFAVDPLTDIRTARATLPALQGTGAEGDPIEFIVQCRDERTEVLLDWGHFLPNQQEVTLRLDSDEPQRTFWDPDRNSTRALYRSDGAALARALATRRRLVARVNPPRRDPITAIFDLTGMSDALVPIGEACGW
jgi:type VI secretion system protein VasI